MRLQPTAKNERALRSIIQQAERLRPTIEEDEQMYYLIGAIVANAEDAIGALEFERQGLVLDAMLRGGIRLP